MLEVDKGGRDDERDEDPVSDRDLPGKRLPNDEKEKSGEQFDRKIAEGNTRATPGAVAAQQ